MVIVIIFVVGNEAGLIGGGNMTFPKVFNGLPASVYTSGSSGTIPLPSEFGIGYDDLWNVQSFSGNITTFFTGSGGMEVSANIYHVTAYKNGILGYPSIGYGYSGTDYPQGSSSSQLLFPMPLTDFSTMGVEAMVNYSFNYYHTPLLPTDFAFDMYLETQPTQGKYPTHNDIEVMVGLYDSYNPFLGSVIGSFNSNVMVNGHIVTQDWVVYESHSNAWSTIYFLPTETFYLSSANITISLAPFLIHATTIVSPTTSFSLMGIELGTEFGNEHFKADSVNWTIYYYLLVVDGVKIPLLGGG